MRLIAMALFVALGLVSCNAGLITTQDEKRWHALDGKQVILMEGYEKIVHSNPECPKLKSERGTAIPCKVKEGRLVDEAGNYKNGPETRFPLCTCVN